MTGRNGRKKERGKRESESALVGYSHGYTVIDRDLFTWVFFYREGFDPNLDVDDCCLSDSDDEDLPDGLTPSRQGYTYC